jgi:hypothetical protein
MKDRIRGIMLAGIIITFIFASHMIADLFQIYKGDKNIWWTHRDMRMSLGEASANFELYISGKSLQRHLSEGTLFAKDNQDQTYKVVAKDVTARMNNWYRRKASLLEKTLWSSFCAGVGIAFLIAGLVMRYTVKERK